jgi:hypothetical protein
MRMKPNARARKMPMMMPKLSVCLVPRRESGEGLTGYCTAAESAALRSSGQRPER